MIVKHPDEDSVFITDNKTGLVTKVDYSEEEIKSLVNSNLGRATEGLAISEDGHRLYVANRFTQRVHTLHTSNLTQTTVHKTKGGAIRLALYGPPRLDRNLLTTSLFNPLGSRLNSYGASSGEHEFSMESVGGFWNTWNPIPLPVSLMIYPGQLSPSHTTETAKERDDRRAKGIRRGKTGKGEKNHSHFRVFRALVSNSWAGQVSLVNLTERRVERFIKTGGHPDGMAFSPLCPPPVGTAPTHAHILNEALHGLEVEFSHHVRKGYSYTEDNYREDQTVSAYSIIEKPIGKVWPVVSDFAGYARWNRFLTNVTVDEGRNTITFNAHIYQNRGPVTRTFELSKVSEEEKEVCWSRGAFLGQAVVAKRCLYLRALANGHTIYFTRDHFKNCLAGLTHKLISENVKRGLEEEARNLKEFCEQPTLQSSFLKRNQGALPHMSPTNLFKLVTIISISVVAEELQLPSIIRCAKVSIDSTCWA